MTAGAGGGAVRCLLGSISQDQEAEIVLTGTDNTL